MLIYHDKLLQIIKNFNNFSKSLAYEKTIGEK